MSTDISGVQSYNLNVAVHKKKNLNSKNTQMDKMTGYMIFVHSLFIT
jgi:hypothetical protein